MSVAEEVRSASRDRLTPVGKLMRLDPVERVRVRADELGCAMVESASTPGQWRGRCPAHGDDAPSLALAASPDGRAALIHCHAGCDWRQVLKALNLPGSVLSARGARRARLDAESSQREGLSVRRSNALMTDASRLRDLLRHEGWTPEALEALMVGTYGPETLAIPERAASGRIVGVALRVPRYQERPGLTLKRQEIAGTPRALAYRAGGPAASTVLLVEGATCALAAMSLGFEAVAMPSSNGLKPEWRSVLARRDVIVLPDADGPGRMAAQEAAELLLPCSESVRVVEVFPDAQAGEDVADLLRESTHDDAARHLREAIDASDVLRRPRRGRPPTERHRVEEYLRETLADGLRHDATSVFEGRPLTDAGVPVSRRTYMEARKIVGVVAERDGTLRTLRLPRPRPRRGP